MAALQREERILWFVFSGLALVIMIVIVGTYWYWRYRYHPIHGRYHQRKNSRRQSVSSRTSAKSKRAVVDEESGHIELSPTLANDVDIIKTAPVSKLDYHGLARNHSIREARGTASPPIYAAQFVLSDVGLGSISNLSMNSVHYYSNLPSATGPLPISASLIPLPSYPLPMPTADGSPNSRASLSDEERPLTRSGSKGTRQAPRLA